jgi:hypothetical protein
MDFDVILGLRYEILTMVGIRILISLVETQCRLVDRYQLLEGTFYLHRQGRRILLLGECTEKYWLSILKYTDMV